MSSKIGQQFRIIALFCIASYTCIVAFSIIFYTLHHPDLINYVKESFLMALSHEIAPIGIWLVLAVLYWYAKCGGYDIEDAGQDKDDSEEDSECVKPWIWILWKERMLSTCIIITLVFLHASLAIKHANAQHASLCRHFKSGKSELPNHVDTNYDQSWPGWAYYYSDNYYSQTKERLQQSRAHLVELRQFEQILLALKDINDGIYSTRSWLTNHRLAYDLLSISCGLLGTMIVGMMWAAWGCGCVCSKNWVYKGLKVCLFSLLWLLMPVLGLFGEFAHSMVLMNGNPVCLPKPNSGVVVITINSSSVNRILQLKLTLIEDPNNIYGNVCYNMQRYYETPVEQDKFIIKHVINVSLVGFVWVFLSEILWMIYSARISNCKFNRNSHKIGYNSINQNQ